MIPGKEYSAQGFAVDHPNDAGFSENADHTSFENAWNDRVNTTIDCFFTGSTMSVEEICTKEKPCKFQAFPYNITIGDDKFISCFKKEGENGENFDCHQFPEDSVLTLRQEISVGFIAVIFFLVTFILSCGGIYMSWKLDFNSAANVITVGGTRL